MEKIETLHVNTGPVFTWRISIRTRHHSLADTRCHTHWTLAREKCMRTVIFSVPCDHARRHTHTLARARALNRFDPLARALLEPRELSSSYPRSANQSSPFFPPTLFSGRFFTVWYQWPWEMALCRWPRLRSNVSNESKYFFSCSHKVDISVRSTYKSNLL